MKKEEYFCDVCDAPAKNIGVTVPVTFTTEQTEGRSCAPYIQISKLDLCFDCLKEITNNQPVRASGAQGHNTYKAAFLCERTGVQGG